MPGHDPLNFVTSLSAKLATRSRHVCVFLGAGVGKSCGLPDVEGLQRQVLEDLGEDDRAAFRRQLTGRNLEEALSRVRRISALVSGEDTVDELTSIAASELDSCVCRAVVKAVGIDNMDLTAARYLAAWAGRANYHLPLELFTVNYMICC